MLLGARIERVKAPRLQAPSTWGGRRASACGIRPQAEAQGPHGGGWPRPHPLWLETPLVGLSPAPAASPQVGHSPLQSSSCSHCGRDQVRTPRKPAGRVPPPSGRHPPHRPPPQASGTELLL